MKWFEIAKNELHTAERKGSEHNPRIIEYHSTTSLKATDDETPWCSAFANWCMKQAGLVGTGSAAARSWLKWGIPLETPREGCVVVLKRGAPPSGHVCFFVGNYDNHTIICLGGNQADQVKYSNYKKTDVLAYRWPEGVK